MGDVRPITGRESRGMLLDDRGTGLRLSWHDPPGLAVLSLWRDDRCIATFRATPADMATVISILSQALAGAAGGAGGTGLGVPDSA